jgi:hypothetical protein
MKRILLAAAGACCLAMPAEAKSSSRSFYNERGSFAGSSVTRGEFDVVQRRPRAGFRQRSPARELDELHDRSGHYTGSIMNTSPRR